MSRARRDRGWTRELTRRAGPTGFATLAVLLALAAPAAGDPVWWVTVGGQAAIETGDLDKTLGTEGAGLLGIGWHALRVGSILVGAEAEGSAGLVHASLGLVTDTVTVWRGRGGIRVTWLEEDTLPVLVPYLRGGAVYRADRGRFVRDEGVGWYGGIGLDWSLAERWAVGPFATYEEVSLSIPTRTWLFGLQLRYSR